MPGYIKIVLLDETGKTINSSLCTIDGNLVFNHKKKEDMPSIVQQILKLIENEAITLKQT